MTFSYWDFYYLPDNSLCGNQSRFCRAQGCELKKVVSPKKRQAEAFDLVLKSKPREISWLRLLRKTTALVTQGGLFFSSSKSLDLWSKELCRLMTSQGRLDPHAYPIKPTKAPSGPGVATYQAWRISGKLVIPARFRTHFSPPRPS